MYIRGRPVNLFLKRILCELLGHRLPHYTYDLNDKWTTSVDCERCKDIIQVHPFES